MARIDRSTAKVTCSISKLQTAIEVVSGENDERDGSEGREPIILVVVQRGSMARRHWSIIVGGQFCERVENVERRRWRGGGRRHALANWPACFDVSIFQNITNMPFLFWDISGIILAQSQVCCVSMNSFQWVGQNGSTRSAKFFSILKWPFRLLKYLKNIKFQNLLINHIKFKLLYFYNSYIFNWIFYYYFLFWSI